MANQTHKTIIFEEFNTNDKPNLYTILNDNPTNDTLFKGLQKLTVKNFDEFMREFAPKIYETSGRNKDTGDIEFFYTTDSTRFPNCRPVDIREHAFYKMLSRLYSVRGESGQATLQFDDKEILEILTPKKELDNVRDIRQKMDYNLQLFYEAKARGDRGGMNSAKSKLTECREKISQYATSSINKLLPILIEDTTRKLELLGAGSIDDSNDSGKTTPQLDYGVLYLNAAGQIDIDTGSQTLAIAAPKNSSDKNTALVVQNENLPAQVTTLPANATQSAKNPVPDKQTLQNKIAETITRDYDKTATNPNEHVRSLILSTFAPLSSRNSNSEVTKLGATELITLRQNLENIYTNALKSFAVEMSRIVESLLGVKAFFDHATVDGGEFSEIPGGVIISNCKASRLLKIKDTFAKYMKQLGKGESGSERIWFAVVPNVLQEPPEKIDFSISEDDDDPFGGDIGDNVDNDLSDEEYVSLNNIIEFLGVMNEAKIMTVFNVRVKGGNTFDSLSAKEVENKIKEFEPCHYAHAVYAYPNFTLIRERDYYPFDENRDVRVTLPEILTDAAYPAAGLLVASQQPKVLDRHKLKYDKSSACVSIDFENIHVKKKLATKFNRESVFRRTEDVTKAINENMFGFVFSGDKVEDSDGVWKNSYVHCARSLAKIRNSNTYKPIYQTLTEDYIAQKFLLLTSKKKSDVEKNLVKKINKEFEEKNAQNAYKDFVNLLLREGEFLRLENDGSKDKIIVHFVGGDSDIDADVESD